MSTALGSALPSRSSWHQHGRGQCPTSQCARGEREDLEQLVVAFFGSDRLAHAHQRRHPRLPPTPPQISLR
eukprot:3934423-Rhodomonas_salina.3